MRDPQGARSRRWDCCDGDLATVSLPSDDGIEAQEMPTTPEHSAHFEVKMDAVGTDVPAHPWRLAPQGHRHSDTVAPEQDAQFDGEVGDGIHLHGVTHAVQIRVEELHMPRDSFMVWSAVRRRVARHQR